MLRKTLSNTVIECTVGDIVAQRDLDAVVNAANAQLRTGGGVAGALHRAAGPELEAECRPLAPIGPGQAVITGAYRLPNRWVIHCLGPVYGRDEPAEELLSACYRKALRLAEQHGIRSIGFPSISTGAFGYPMPAAAAVALRTVIAASASLETVQLVRFVLFDRAALDVHEAALENAIRATASAGRTH